MKTSEINIKVTTDINHLPEQITWEATDSGVSGINECRSMLLALWDAENQNTLKIDLWTKEMTVEEMKLFFYQTLLSMSETLERSTAETNAAEDLREFCKHFAKTMGIESNAKKA
ncbi:MAG: gliding motility protein GldC [Bacteroidia bacterium]|nr:gliding motility protein GldC [Bacteroidia bacterium]MCZ2247324.1 gliding motility protein GldC [Bacteroidia bacterium]